MGIFFLIFLLVFAFFITLLIFACNGISAAQNPHNPTNWNRVKSYYYFKLTEVCIYLTGTLILFIGDYPLQAQDIVFYLIRLPYNLYCAYVLFSWFTYVKAGKINLVNFGKETEGRDIELQGVIQGTPVQIQTTIPPPQPIIHHGYEEQINEKSQETP